MIALLRFLEHREVVVEFLFGFERRAVNALELRIFFVALVVRAGDGGQLECADVSRAHHVRPGAEIDEIAVAIERNLFVGRNVFDDVEFEFAGLGSFAQTQQAGLFCRARALRLVETSIRSNGWFALISFFISASIFSKSSGEMRWGRSTS